MEKTVKKGRNSSIELLRIVCLVMIFWMHAADSGVAVRVPADACAGSTPENQELALNTMRLFEPLVTVTDTDTILN